MSLLCTVVVRVTEWDDTLSYFRLRGNKTQHCDDAMSDS